VPPEQRTQQTENEEASTNIVIDLKADGTIEINGQVTTVPELDARFHAIYDVRPQKILFVKSAPNRLYEEVIEVMDLARGAGVQVIRFPPPEAATN